MRAEHILWAPQRLITLGTFRGFPEYRARPIVCALILCSMSNFGTVTHWQDTLIHKLAFHNSPKQHTYTRNLVYFFFACMHFLDLYYIIPKFCSVGMIGTIVLFIWQTYEMNWNGWKKGSIFSPVFKIKKCYGIHIFCRAHTAFSVLLSESFWVGIQNTMWE